MCIKLYSILIVLLMVLPQPSGADELTLEEAISRLLSANPDIQAAHYQAKAARSKIPQAKSLADPMVGVEFYNVPIDTVDVTRSEDIDYKLQQEIPFPGKRHVRGKSARFDAKAEEAMSRGKIQDILLDLKNTYYDLYRLDRVIQVNGENQKLFRQLLGSAETAYATGKAAGQAPLKAQIELSKLQNEEINLEQEQLTHQSHLRALLGHSFERQIKLPQTIPWPRLETSLEELEEMALKSRPELESATAMADRDRTRVTEAKQNWIPDLKVGLVYKQNPTGLDQWAAESMINLPIFFAKNAAKVKEAKAMKQASSAEAQSLALHTRHEVRSAWSSVKASENLVASYKKGILPQAKINLATAQTAYASGRIDFMPLMDAATTYKELQMGFYETQARLGMNLAKLERIVGKPLFKEDL